MEGKGEGSRLSLSIVASNRKCLSRLSFGRAFASFDLIEYEKDRERKGLVSGALIGGVVGGTDKVKHKSLSRLLFGMTLGNTDVLGGRKVSVQSTRGNLALGRWLGLGIW